MIKDAGIVASIVLGVLLLMVACFISGYDYHSKVKCEASGYSYSYDLSVCVKLADGGRK